MKLPKFFAYLLIALYFFGCAKELNQSQSFTQKSIRAKSDSYADSVRDTLSPSTAFLFSNSLNLNLVRYQNNGNLQRTLTEIPSAAPSYVKKYIISEIDISGTSPQPVSTSVLICRQALTATDDLFKIALNTHYLVFDSYQAAIALQATRRTSVIAKMSSTDSSDISNVDAAPPPKGKANCIDWYYVTWNSQTGEIISEIYLGTTCASGSGGGGGSSNPGSKPGDRACSSSFNYKNSPLHYLTNVYGLQFEDGTNVNPIPRLGFSLNNGILDVNMNKEPGFDYFGQGETCLEYLQDIFPDLFSSGDIYASIVDGQKQWNFSKYAAQRISAYTVNFGATNVQLQDPTAAFPTNSNARNQFYTQTNQIIKCFMPGSYTTKNEISNGTTTNATYSPGCK